MDSNRASQLPTRAPLWMRAALLFGAAVLLVCVAAGPVAGEEPSGFGPTANGADDAQIGDPLDADYPSGSTQRPYQIPRSEGEVKVDGRLDEGLWNRAAVIALPYETRPAENTPAPVDTEALVFYDTSTLYVGFRAKDPDPKAIRAHLSDRDTAWNDDFVGIVIDTFNDERRAVEFFSTPLGVQMDLFNDDVGRNETESSGQDG